MYSRLAFICHYWPGLTPFNIWQLPADEWLLFAKFADELKQRGESWQG